MKNITDEEQKICQYLGEKIKESFNVKESVLNKITFSFWGENVKFELVCCDVDISRKVIFANANISIKDRLLFIKGEILHYNDLLIYL